MGTNVTHAKLQNAYAIAAELVADDPVYLPLFLRLEAQMRRIARSNPTMP